jgi:hypothetical protein
MTMTDNERRQFFRIEVETPVKFRLIEENTGKPLWGWVNGSTADVGLGGIKIVASVSQDEAEMLVDKYVVIELSFTLPGSKQAITSKAGIAYFLRGASKANSTKVTFGVSFIGIDSNSEDILGEFIRKRIDAPSS